MTEKLEHSTTPDLQGATILIVDDNPANLGVLSHSLEAYGFKVLVAQKAETGLKTAQRVQPDLILLDVLLPDLDGFETCRRLKANELTQDIPVIFMTALAETEDKIKGFKVGAVDYITKPFHREEALARITIHLRLQRLTGNLQEQNVQLHLAQEALHQANEALELRVEERTAELSQANIILQEQITERLRIQAEREALITELEAKNTELERFTYTVSHDLKSPLITIQGFLGYLEQAALAGDIAQVKADVARITNAVSMMKQLLDDLLELSRIGRLVNSPEQVSLAELAHEAVTMVADRLAKRGIEVQIASNLPLVYGDRARLHEVLENLVNNAVKFMGNQAQPCIEIGVRLDGAESVFFVKDNGVGIEPRYQQKVFGLFEKLDPKVEGTGVGLALVKQIVEVHGGRIWVESAGTGQGSAFCFTLPLADHHEP